jgi:hypothetical protein
LDATYHLAYRTKSQELWRGAFGLILGQSAYYYAPQYSSQGIGFLTVPDANLGCIDHPTALQTPPDSRVFQLDAIRELVNLHYDRSRVVRQESTNDALSA